MLIGLVPVYLVPRRNQAAGGICFRFHDYLLFGDLRLLLALKDQMEVCPLSCGVMLSYDSTPIRAITVRLSLFPSSYTCTPIVGPCGLSTLSREGYRLTVFHLSNHGCVRSSLSTGSFLVRVLPEVKGVSSFLPFWFRLFFAQLI